MLELIFFFQLAQLSGSKQHLETAQLLFEQVLRSLKAWLREEGRAGTPAHNRGIGGFIGPASVYYALLRASALGDARQLKSVRTLLFAYLPRAIASDQRLDWIAGSAGLIGVLCSSLQQSEDGAEADFILLAADHLLGTRLDGSDASWRTMRGSVHTGIGHGAAGIALALAFAATATGYTRFLDIASSAHRWENSHFLPQLGNWRDLRGYLTSGLAAEPGAALGWCAGAPGIGAARARAGESAQALDCALDIAEGFRTTLRCAGQTSTDGWCHGYFGLLECMLEMAAGTGTPEWARMARGLLVEKLIRVSARGFSFVGTTMPVSLMVGLAGIGCSLLRFSSDEDLACALSLQLGRRREHLAGAGRVRGQHVE